MDVYDIRRGGGRVVDFELVYAEWVVQGMRCGDNCERMEVREWKEWEGLQILGFLGLCGLVCFKLRFSVVRGSHIVLVLHI